jgi:ABC-type transport system involved in cytochrome c biogenesis permease component
VPKAAIGLCWMGLGLACLLGVTRAFRVKLPELQLAE